MSADLPDDISLTEEGMAPHRAGRLLVLACGAIAREILAVIEANGLSHVTLQCLPAILHNRPEQIVPAVEAAVEAARGRYDRIFLGYGDCGTGGALERAAERLGVKMLPGAHCYAFLEGVDSFADRSEEEFTAFYLTDFLARQFDAFVWKPLGLDRHPELRDMYFGNYDRLVYQAQTDDPELTRMAEDAAERLGLRFVRRRTGYGDLETRLLGFAKSSSD